MPSASIKPHTLIIIAGPTAVGKTAFAVELAERFGTEILSADSRQFYRELNIGTAKPGPDELGRVRHHFIGNLSIQDYYNVSRYEQDALQVLDQLFTSRQLAVMAGGSGLYIDAVCRGVDEFPDPDPELRAYLKGLIADHGIGKLHELLRQKDPAYLEMVDLANPNRLLRALEVCFSTGKPYSEQRNNPVKERDFRILKICLNLPRAELFDRINGRVEVMMQNGLLDEVRSMLPERHLNALNTVGYKELFEYLNEKISLDQAVENIKTNTRRYAKRQLTWFRKDPEYHWFEPGDMVDVIRLVQNYL